MILKLRMRDSKRGIAWRLLDKIKKIDYEYVNEKIVIANQIKDTDLLYINNYPVNSPEAKKVAVVYIVFEDGLGDMFYTDDMVYIMNDNGKTCDTINV